jgi:glycosyltransferase involved in cell wall biosynthesis
MILNVCTPGHLDPYDSYGLIACQLLRHLSALGAHVNLWAMGERKPDSLPADLAALVEQPMRAVMGGILLGYPTGFKHFPYVAQMGRRVAITMFESSRLPSGWVDELNQCAAVITPSTFCREVFLDCGITSPIHVIPLGVNPIYKPAEREPDHPFTFLAFLDRGLRKGGIAALQAFVRAFGDDPAYKLILKRRSGKLPAIVDNPNIEIISQDMTEDELYALYLQADCLVNPNKGEGFGIIPREFAATGGISLATGWGGTADRIGLWGVELPYTLERADWSGAKNLQGQDLGFWAEPDIEGIARIMRHVADNRETYHDRAAQRAEMVRRLYDWRAFAIRVLDVWGGDPSWQTYGSLSPTSITFGDGEVQLWRSV